MPESAITVVFGVYNVNKQLRIVAPKRLPAVIAKQPKGAPVSKEI